MATMRRTTAPSHPARTSNALLGTAVLTGTGNADPGLVQAMALGPETRPCLSFATRTTNRSAEGRNRSRRMATGNAIGRGSSASVNKITHVSLFSTAIDRRRTTFGQRASTLFSAPAFSLLAPGIDDT